MDSNPAGPRGIRTSETEVRPEPPIPVAQAQVAPPVTSADEEAVLIARAQKGDAAAFEKLYRHNVGRVFALCLRMCADRAQAEELTQDAFIRAWQKLSLFRGESAFSTWIHRLTVNVVLQRSRTDRRRERRVESTDDVRLLSGPAPAATPGKRIDLERALETLPAGARRVFVLHDVEGYKHHEIAELTGSAVGTSKAQLHRARKLLRKALER